VPVGECVFPAEIPLVGKARERRPGEILVEVFESEP
jgi:hypothetical protein